MLSQSHICIFASLCMRQEGSAINMIAHLQKFPAGFCPWFVDSDRFGSIRIDLDWFGLLRFSIVFKQAHAVGLLIRFDPNDSDWFGFRLSQIDSDWFGFGLFSSKHMLLIYWFGLIRIIRIDSNSSGFGFASKHLLFICRFGLIRIDPDWFGFELIRICKQALAVVL